MNYTAAKEFILNKLKRELPQGLYYHGLHHTLDVLDATIRLAKMEKTSKEELTLLKTAALFHDAGFIDKYFLNEEIGAKIAKKSLAEFGYSPQQIKIVCNIIMATRIEIEPANKLEEIIRDADLDYLGRNDFYKIADSLKKELYEHGLKYNENQWKTILLDFLKKHTYYTQSAKQMRDLQKLKYIKEIEGN